MDVRTSVGSGVKHIVQHCIMVHIKPVSDVSQSVWPTEITQVKENGRQTDIIITWQHSVKSCRPIIRIQGVLCINEDDFSA